MDCNLEAAHFYSMRIFQRFRIKRWDYYAVFTPRGFFSATIADLGYAGILFVYVMDFETKELHAEDRLDLTFTPLKERVAKTKLGIVFSEVNQIFGHYNEKVIADDGEVLQFRDLVGFAEEHHARW